MFIPKECFCDPAEALTLNPAQVCATLVILPFGPLFLQVTTSKASGSSGGSGSRRWFLGEEANTHYEYCGRVSGAVMILGGHGNSNGGSCMLPLEVCPASLAGSFRRTQETSLKCQLRQCAEIPQTVRVCFNITSLWYHSHMGHSTICLLNLLKLHPPSDNLNL